MKILYIAGSSRNGGTLLGRMLGELPGFASVGEMRQIWSRGCLQDVPCGCHANFSACPFWTRVGTEAFGGWDGLDLTRTLALREKLDRPTSIPLLVTGAGSPRFKDEVREYVGLLGRLYRGIEGVSGAEAIVDWSKSPSHALLLSKIPGAEVRVVHLVRDSRGVAFSFLRPKRRRGEDRSGKSGRAGEVRKTPIASSLHWLFTNALPPLMSGPTRPYMRLRYEDLLANPRRVLEAVIEFAAVRRSDLPFLNDGKVTLGPSHTVWANRMRFKQGEITLRQDDWRTALPGRTRIEVTAMTLPLLWRFGYVPSPAQPGP